MRLGKKKRENVGFKLFKIHAKRNKFEGRKYMNRPVKVKKIILQNNNKGNIKCALKYPTEKPSIRLCYTQFRKETIPLK